MMEFKLENLVVLSMLQIEPVGNIFNEVLHQHEEHTRRIIWSRHMIS